MQNLEVIKTDLENELLYVKGSIPGSKNSEILVKQSVKVINKMSIKEKIIAAEEAKKTPDKKKR
jgi:large subunit ribosomal protein L3